MAIKIERSTLSTSDPLVRPSDNLFLPRGGAFHLALLSGYAYGLMDESFLREGMLVSSAAQSFITIVHCAATKRTSLCQTPTNLCDFSCFAELFSWLAEDSPAASVEVLIVYDPTTSTPSPTFQASLRSSAAPSIALTFSTELQPSPFTLIEVAKVTARTRILQIPFGYGIHVAATSAIEEGSRMNNLWSGILGIEAALRQMKNQSPRPPPMQYDGTRIAPRLPTISDDVQTLLKGAWEKEGRGRGAVEGFLMDKIANFERWVDPTTPKGRLEAYLMMCQGQEAFCAVCGSNGEVLRCSGCGWATYCSPMHQRDNWAHHRSWCKKNRRSTHS
ncbi:hypothetical protein BCR35DRAFT_330610 [Leucosporidium creatinivorum]|uniref:MYND-type domain-containing protein n=1 Tax=Leucosporidium creatinivorum TaxID=106004 RepID=A0A1Y2FRV3_9BASI|nr:hypothetical protein BCR35DRAFT_330610 [Leucosporidium creatinivorum]